MNENIFYADCNATQTKNLVMEYMKFDISSTFSSLLNEEEKAILEEILKFKKLREEDEGMRDNQKEKFGSADPKKYTTRQIEEYLIEKFKIDEKITRRISVNGREGKRFSSLTIHRLLTKEGYVEQKLSMIKRLEDLNKKDKK